MINGKEKQSEQKIGSIKLVQNVAVIDHGADAALDRAAGKLNKVFILGLDKENNFYFDNNQPDAGELLWLMEVAKRKMMDAAINN